MTPMLLSVLAQTPTQTPTQPTAAPQLGPAIFLALMFAMVTFMMLSARSRTKREKREREQMYATMSKNVRVVTIGGVVGTIVAVKDDEVVLKVDESTNTKMTFIKSAVQRVLGDDSLKGPDKL